MRRVLTVATIGLMAATAYADERRARFRPIRVEDGVFVYPDGEDVALFGTNYYPNCWYQYENMRAVGVDFREAIRQDVADMKDIGIEIIRGVVFDREAADAEGNLIENEHLAVFDILVDEMNRQGVYLYLTALLWWESPDTHPGAYPTRYTKMGMMFDEEAIACGVNFTQQLLNHVNPHTGRALKDEPCLAVIELFNEPWYFPYAAVANADWDPGFLAWQTKPEVFQKDLKHWRERFAAWRRERGLEQTKEAHEQFQYETMSGYLETMIGAIRATGAEQPIASCLFETWDRNKGVLRAIGDSELDAVTDGWYPGGFDQLNEETNQLGDTTPAGHAGAQAYELPEDVRDKAMMVYEFDVCRTYDNVSLYPVMVRHFRSAGAQIICHFQYDAAATARFQPDWGVHFVNKDVAPAKSVAFQICSELTEDVPRGEDYELPVDNAVFHDTAVSFEHMQVMRATEEAVYHAHPLGDWRPLALPEAPKRITGRGGSPYAAYEGDGYYEVEVVDEGLIRLRATPNASLLEPVDKSFFDTGRLDRPLVELNREPRAFRLLLPGWERFTCQREDGESVPVEDRAFALTPGVTYLLRKAE